MTSKLYTFSDFLKNYFPYKVQKIMVDGGFSCPNRDGRIGVGGCTYCRNDSFNPSYCRKNASIKEQISAGIEFFSRKNNYSRYVAYFQSYSNTYAGLERLKSVYEEALSVEGVEGLILGTRPDCIDEELLDYLKELSYRYFVMVEYGVESCFDKTLLRINRGHDFQCCIDAIERTSKRGIPVGIHLIFGLPGETGNDILSQAEIISKLPISTLKIHQLQILKGTAMYDEWLTCPNDFLHLSLDDYIDMVLKFISRLPKHIAIDRFVSSSPSEMLVYPKWGVKPGRVQKIIEEKLCLYGV